MLPEDYRASDSFSFSPTARRAAAEGAGPGQRRQLAVADTMDLWINIQRKALDLMNC